MTGARPCSPLRVKGQNDPYAAQLNQKTREKWCHWIRSSDICTLCRQITKARDNCQLLDHEYLIDQIFTVAQIPLPTYIRYSQTKNTSNMPHKNNKANIQHSSNPSSHADTHPQLWFPTALFPLQLVSPSFTAVDRHRTGQGSA